MAETPERVLVKFPDAESPVAFFTSLQTQAPPMEFKEGWHVGESVVYLGDDREAGGKRLCAGMPCKVVGPGAEESSVAVQFPGFLRTHFDSEYRKALRASRLCCSLLAGGLGKVKAFKVRGPCSQGTTPSDFH
ncbi:unnamed protein product [Cladocopium goreaui]|uniref:Uncharacterized protein n=1 Tax=Cladocopium goreaui TaxID=2562237 RepID=A0A9P1CK05_9DINO|nr:unnamed protein product [Cladocopium goreaui]|mmetsp:Transcript_3901/g.9093  ORF Transcript_3901/g.9093 Transcript_3901/m.9093 type:complete len:133 (+) Transcript_3901:94-492(+)